MARAPENRRPLLLFGVFFLFAFWVAFALIYGKGGVIERRRLLDDLERLRDEVAGLEEQSRYLDWRIENLRSDRRSIEACARELGFKREGELVFRFMKKNPDQERR